MHKYYTTVIYDNVVVNLCMYEKCNFFAVIMNVAKMEKGSFHHFGER